MPNPPKRATVYFDPEIHRALRLKAAATDRIAYDIADTVLIASTVRIGHRRDVYQRC